MLNEFATWRAAADLHQLDHVHPAPFLLLHVREVLEALYPSNHNVGLKTRVSCSVTFGGVHLRVGRGTSCGRRDAHTVGKLDCIGKTAVVGSTTTTAREARRMSRTERIRVLLATR
jgi:hypothetical protein